MSKFHRILLAGFGLWMMTANFTVTAQWKDSLVAAGHSEWWAIAVFAIGHMVAGLLWLEAIMGGRAK